MCCGLKQRGLGPEQAPRGQFTRFRFKLLNKILGGSRIYSVLKQKPGHVLEEMQRPGAPLSVMSSLISLSWSRLDSVAPSGLEPLDKLFPTVRVRPLGSSDPMEAGSQSAQLVSDIRKRKGLKEQMTPLSEFEDKLQFTFSCNC